MSRSGYSDDYDDPLALGRWRQAVSCAIKGKRGQAFLRDLAGALDAMDDKRLYNGSFATPEGEFCTLGVLGSKRGTKLDDLCSDDGECDSATVGQRFGIARAMAAEIMYLNDEYMVDTKKWVDVEVCGPISPYYPDRGRRTRSYIVDDPEHQKKRWKRMREWVDINLDCTPRSPIKEQS
jgi:hypothetical protein